MKKTFIVFISILVSVFLLLNFLDRKGEYVSERELWRINKKLTNILKDPKAVPDTAFYKLIGEYEDFIKTFHNSKLAPVAGIFLSRVYTAKKDYKQALKILSNLLKKYPNNKILDIRIFLEMAHIYSTEGDLDKVISIYDTILKRYPYTQIGMQSPMIKARIYARQNKKKAREIIAKATTYYQKIATEHPTERLGFNAMLFKASCYEALGNNKAAVDTLADTLDKFADTKVMTASNTFPVIKTINSLALAKLNNLDVAVKIYEKFIEKHPNNKFNDLLSAIIARLHKIEQQQNSKNKTKQK